MATKPLGRYTLTVLLAGYLGCSGSDVVGPPTLASVSISPEDVTLVVGGTLQLTATPRDRNGNTIVSRAVAWTTSDASTATVTSTGLVTGVSEGSVTISATCEGQADTVTITVTRVAVAGARITPTSPSLTVGDSLQLLAEPLDSSGNALTGRVVTWSSGDEAVATVTQTGIVSGVTAGTVTITATVENIAAGVEVTVQPAPVASVALTPATTRVVVNDSVQLTATPKDRVGNPLPDRAVSWSSSDSAVAAVSSTGLVRALMVGRAWITATSEGKSGMARVDVVPPAAVSRFGRWSPVMDWQGVIAIHMHMLPTGKVLAWGGENNSHGSAGGQTTVLWTPGNWRNSADPGTLTLGYNSGTDGTDIFCSGHAFLPDGQLLVSGGHQGNELGVVNTNIFDPVRGMWRSESPMSYARWYPTVTTLPSGELLTIAGTNETGENVPIPEVWQLGGGWRPLNNASRALPYYPWMFVAPTGKVFYAGPGRSTAYLSTDGPGAWSTVASSSFGSRDYGSAVMYEPGKVLIVGGGNPATNTAEVIDLNQGAPVWRYTSPMAFARRQINATILPDGKVLVTGGTSLGFSDPAGKVLEAEVWDPATGSWSTLASMAVERLYHSTAVLLPDGRILSAGGGRGASSIEKNHPDAEIFYPPYLFAPDGSLAERPAIASAPDNVGYGETFAVGTPDAANVAAVTLVRLSSVTHAFNMNQRFNRLNFAAGADGLTVTAPASPNLAPPGHYMLFLLNSDGVPSVAKIIRVG